ncbi:kinase-like domain-containing protein [Rhizophagus clarus]|uniref:Kinase-like domain-containing protein n=1 Tax=Rhizophagus clarus TaxID=94130 RepID=A0A8H3MC29_9GLOM|nr:kinase-like domain-containing protein [Rhizophagus clarus]
MSITLLCLVKGNTTANAFPVDIEKDRLVGHLKEAIKAKKQSDFAGVDADKLKLWKVEIPDDQDDQLANLLLNDQTELLVTRDIGDYWTGKPLKRHINIIISSPLLNLEEALSCVPLPITYSSCCVMTKTTTKLTVTALTSTQHLSPRFVVKEVVNEEDVRIAIDFNICIVLSGLMVPRYNFLRLPMHTKGVSDFTCFYLSNLLVLMIEVKRKHILQDIGEDNFPKFYQKNKKVRMAVQQVFNYMIENKLKYSILSMYDNHWFLKWEYTKLWISKTLLLQSTSPPVLKTYAYLAHQAQSDPHSSHPLQVLVQANVDNNSRVLRFHSKLSSYQVPDNQSPSSHTQTYNVSVKQQKFSFADFKFQSILGEGQSGKTLRCEYRGNTIALKSADLSKTLPDVLKKMKKRSQNLQDPP